MIDIRKAVFSWLLTPIQSYDSCPNTMQHHYSYSAMVFFLQQNCRRTYRVLGSGALSRSVSGFVCRGINIPYQFRCNRSARGQSPKAWRSLKLSKLQDVQNVVVALLVKIYQLFSWSFWFQGATTLVLKGG